MTLITDKIFLVIDGLPSTSFIVAIEPLKQIDSVFFYSPTSDSIDDISKQQYSYLVYLCETEETLIDSIRKSREELDEHIAALIRAHVSLPYSKTGITQALKIRSFAVIETDFLCHMTWRSELKALEAFVSLTDISVSCR
ncbi:unnamed protein product [Rotaria sordida]|uniref:Uncharacterized protein n=1 Tax=Rotaria sordida TaxID=392033 RepID=A0A814UQB5_9BILA|nr:unnamed protein product [Rotaria sordida]